MSKGTLLKSFVKGSGGSGGGGSASFPTIVTDSGSSLPVDLSGYQVGDTFLNTSDKKIYTAGTNSYELNTNVTNNGITVDFTTGVSSGFKSFEQAYIYVPAKNITKTNSMDFVWYGNKTFEVVFKMDTVTYGALFMLSHTANSIYTSTGIYIKNDGKIYYRMIKSNTGSLVNQVEETNLLDYVLQANVLYKIVLEKTGNSLKIKLLNKETNTLITENTISTVDWIADEVYSSTQKGTMAYGVCDWSGTYGTFKYALTTGYIYLLDSTGDFLKLSSDLSWDSGTSLTDKTEYADKTNGILYLYENDELVNIPQKNTLSFTNVSASSWVSDSTYADYGYKCELSCSGVTSSMFAQVVFAPTEADSGNYATVCLTGSGTVTIYSKVNDTITIPSIVVMGV